ncbi:MAG: hypothetical protein WC343_01065 [Bacilli bacterium]|jgi:hypothetical protein
MNLLVLENNQLVRYNADYGRTEMKGFLNDIINNYGMFHPMQLKASSENKITLLCDEYRDMRVIKTYQDNSKIHKGRKRISRKGPLVSYLYSFTAIDYPEILYTIVNFLSQKEMAFSFFSKYVNADINVDYNNIDYYIEEGYKSYDKTAIPQLRLSLEDENTRRKHIDDVINRRLLQRECLIEFYHLFELKRIENAQTMDTGLAYYRTLLNNMPQIPGFFAEMEFPRLLGEIINHNKIPELARPKDIEKALRNSSIIDKITITGPVKVKSK